MLRDGEEDSERKESYRTIRTFLVSEMKRRGYATTSAKQTKGACSNASKLKSKRSCGGQGQDILRRTGAGLSGRESGGSVGGVVGADKSLFGLCTKKRWNERILYDDDDDDDCYSRRAINSKRRKIEGNLILDLESEVLAGEVGLGSRKDRTHDSNNVQTEGTESLPRVMYNCLGQLEAPGPSLIAEQLVEEEEDESEEGRDGGGDERKRPGYRVIDNWLVEDLEGEKTKRKKKKHDRDVSVERESRALLGMTNAKERERNAASRINSASSATLSSLSQKSKSLISSEDARQRNSTKPAKNAIIVESSSESPDRQEESSDDEAEFQRWKAHKEAQSTQSHNNTYSTLISTSCSNNVSTPFSGTTSINPYPAHLQSAPPSSLPLPPPMRVRVRILTSSYRIPCPHLQEGGVVTSVAWLANQAAERYFSQHGRRPVLCLTTVDGDSLCQADPVGHVLSQDEEVVGVVQQWFTPPMLERYLVACRTNGTGTENMWIGFKSSKPYS